MKRFLTQSTAAAALLTATCLSHTPAFAQNDDANAAEEAESAPAIELAEPFKQRMNELAEVISGEKDGSEFFAPSFTAQVPLEQFRQISDQLIEQHGQPIAVIGSTPVGAYAAKFELEFEQSIGTIEMTVDQDEPHRVIGLLVTGFARPDDSFEAIATDFEALPGSAGFIVKPLGHLSDQPVLAESNADGRFGIGSAFKLYILSELADQIAAGDHEWAETVPLSEKSFPSGVMHKWPALSPVTLHTLAVQMISISDNTATDQLIATLGADKIGDRMTMINGSSDPDNAPFLNTVQAIALKMASNEELREKWLTASETEQRAILAEEKEALSLDKVVLAELMADPLTIDRIEWFASPRELAKVLEVLRADDDPHLLPILSVNPGLGPNVTKRWDYVGYKGGSEPGVINMSFLACTEEKVNCYAVSGSWNDSEAPVDEMGFVDLMSRLLNQTARTVKK